VGSTSAAIAGVWRRSGKHKRTEKNVGKMVSQTDQ
jgi:hypothetical protein